MNKKNILKISITTIIILVTIFSVFVFKNNNQEIENDTKNIKQEKTIKEKIGKNENTAKQKVLLKNIEFGNKKVDVIEDKNEKDVNDVDITKLIIRDKETGEKVLLENFKATNFIPVKINKTFKYYGDLDEYIIALIDSYQKNIDAGGEYRDISIYNSKGKQINGLESDLYSINLYDKKQLMGKLDELKQEGKL